jgi:hypothetical protein
MHCWPRCRGARRLGSLLRMDTAPRLRFPLDLANLPIRAQAIVFHVGDLESKPRRRTISYEGPGLSVSRCPDAWTRIARLGGYATWTLRRSGRGLGRFLDRHALSQASLSCMTEVAVEAGWIVPHRQIVAVRYDDELERDLWIPCDSVEEALEESGLADDRPVARDASDDDPSGEGNPALVDTAYAAWASVLAAGRRAVLAPHTDTNTVVLARGAGDSEDEGQRIVVCRRWAATPSLERWWGAHFTEALPGTLVETMAHCRLVEECTDLDGLWWADDYDPDRLTAPRGVILPRALQAWTCHTARVAELEAHAEG